MKDAEEINKETIDYDAKRRETGKAICAALKSALHGHDSFEEELYGLSKYTADRGKRLADAISRGLNDFCDGETRRSFLEAMTREHRTLQQSFTGLCLEWLATIAADDYATDGRNEHAQKIARKALANLDKYDIKMPCI